jgi:phosphoribosylanthranilate isomerase
MKIKICGLTRVEDAILAEALGVWAVGFVFYPKSKRFINPKFVGTIKTSVPKVGVFVDQVDEVEAVVRSAHLDIIQLHGNESAKDCEALRRTTGKRLIKAFRPSSDRDIEQIESYIGLVDYVLVDACVDGAFGGTGKKADWSLACEIKKTGIPLILSGGIDDENLIEAKAAVDPFAFDLSSGVEEAPGIKSDAKLRRLFSLSKTL